MKVSVVGAADGLGASLAAGLATTASAVTADLPSDRDGIVVVAGADPRPTPGQLVDIAAAAWMSGAEDPIQQTMALLQRARAALFTGGRIVVVVPTVGMTGSRSLVPYCTAIEGVRGMVKSAARQWGREGIRINVVAVPLWLVAPEVGGLPDHLTPPAIRDRDSLLPTVLSCVEFLLSTTAPNLSGATIVADGGSVMMP